MVFIVLESNEGSLVCGGALINDRYVLTAAHRFHNMQSPKIDVYLGGHFLKDFYLNKTQRVSAEKYIIHEKYEYEIGENIKNDIALIKLANKVKFSLKISPICLPETNDVKFTKYKVAGWGATELFGFASEQLLQIDVSQVSYDECKKVYEQVQSHLHICAGEKGKDSCQGDSGGPLMGRKQGKYYVAGIVSFGSGCGDRPAVYTNIGNYLRWIKSHAMDGDYCPH